MSIHLDTNVLAAIASDEDGPVARRFSEHLPDCAVSAIVAAEVKFGLEKKPSARAARRSVELLELLPQLAWEAPADQHYAEIRLALERAGTPIGANDLFIAAHALALDAVLVTANEREFRRVPGLKVENWAI